VSLAHALGLTVIAESVETEFQAARLRSIGCDSAQGYLYARPGPPQVITSLLGVGFTPPAPSVPLARRPSPRTMRT
jgi:EAL domain-containing protein (putative c-di-GMP-specific phosphodiesterase class I)